MKKIKILRIIARLNVGGPAIHTIILTSCLDKEKFQSLLLAGRVSSGEADMSYFAKEKNVMPVIIPQLSKEIVFLNDILAFLKILKIIRRERPDIIHTHTAKAGTLGRLAAISYNFFKPKKRKIIILHTFHGHVLRGYFGKIKTSIFIFIEKILSYSSNKIITVSESLKSELAGLKICNKDKIEVIPLGLELDKYLAIKEKEESVFKIGIVGRLVPIKNHRLFLGAARRILTAYPTATFEVAGDGELKNTLINLTSNLKISNAVNFLSWVIDLKPFYSSLDILALTSLNEGTPVSVIEAMASGRAVVSTNVGGVRDLLGNDLDSESLESKGFRLKERGVIVDSFDPSAFADAVIFLFRNPELKKKIENNAREFVRNQYSSERLVEDIENLYLSLMACTPRC